MSEKQAKKLQELLSDFDNGTLVTVDGQHLRGRPMHIAERDKVSRLTFATEKATDKVKEVVLNQQVAVTFQADGKFIAVTGVASLSDDRERVRRLWNKAWNLWFEGDADTAAVDLIDVSIVTAEYWDMTGRNRLKFAFEAGKATLTDTTIDTQKLSGHGSV